MRVRIFRERRDRQDVGWWLWCPHEVRDSCPTCSLFLTYTTQHNTTPNNRSLYILINSVWFFSPIYRPICFTTRQSLSCIAHPSCLPSLPVRGSFSMWFSRELGPPSAILFVPINLPKRTTSNSNFCL